MSVISKKRTRQLLEFLRLEYSKANREAEAYERISYKKLECGDAMGNSMAINVANEYKNKARFVKQILDVLGLPATQYLRVEPRPAGGVTMLSTNQQAKQPTYTISISNANVSGTVHLKKEFSQQAATRYFEQVKELFDGIGSTSATSIED